VLDSLLIGKRQCHYGQMMQKISIYDMDKTITRTATFGPFLRYAVPRHQPWRIAMLPFVALTSFAYVAKLINRKRLKEINLGLMLGRRIESAALNRLSAGFAGHTLSKNMLPDALDRMASDRAEGRQIVIASASYAFYVSEIAQLLGVADVVATRATAKDGKVSPAIDGENCYDTTKLRMIEEWMANQGILRTEAHVRFYSDHVSDAPCLRWADEAFATNPHAPLRKLAQAQGWQVFDWA
jgi:HAD superfamily hydrolase (TIGR01490 family)